MTIKRVILVALTILAIALMGQDLLDSWGRPQFQNQLELYQTNLLLQVTELKEADPGMVAAQKALVGEEPLKAALKQYEEVRQTAQKNLDRTQKLLAARQSKQQSLRASLPKWEELITKLDVNLGLLQVAQGQVDTAQQTWGRAAQPTQLKGAVAAAETAAILAGLWSQPPQLLPDAELKINTTLTGWFRFRALAQLYKLQQRPEQLAELQAREQAAAQQSFVNLAIVGGLPVMGALIGTTILLVLLVQWFLQGKQALLSPTGMTAWVPPWDGEIVWQVLIFGFFLVGQILLPLVLGLAQSALGIPVSAMGERAKAVYILVNYGLLAAGGLLVLYWSIKPYLPLPEGWFQINWQGKWILWGLGGYFVALPLVILVSLVNQRIWQGGGGSNPILPIALEGKDSFALFCFFLTAAIAAPFFEEILFRGFLLPSLTRYLPIWGAIGVSSLIFALAHLSLSEVLPLTMLGIVLGFVYTRSRNLLSSMLLHGLWNSGTLISLLILGNGMR